MNKYFKTLKTTIENAEAKLNEIQEVSKIVEVVYVNEKEGELTFLLRIVKND